MEGYERGGTDAPSPALPQAGDGERIEALLDELEAHAPADVWQRVEELVERLCEMYGEGLRRALSHLGASGALDDDTRERLCGDELLASLLLLHGLHPEPTSARVTGALDAVRPVLHAHRGDVALLAIEDGVVRLRLLGTCEGCSSSTRTLRDVIERAIFEAAPEVERVELDQASPPDREPPRAPVGVAAAAGPLVQIGGRASPARHDAVRCELCGAPAGGEHRHVVDRDQRSLLCACRACALLFERGEGGRYRTVPRRVLVEPGLSLTPARLAALGVPVQLAFVFFHSTLSRWVSLYPSPAGPTETVLDDGAMDELLAASTLVRALEPDVEALLVYGRRGGAALECYLAPIDDCYDLVGLVRTSWRGVGGGDEARRDIEAFFRGLRLRATPLASDGQEAP